MTSNTNSSLKKKIAKCIESENDYYRTLPLIKIFFDETPMDRKEDIYKEFFTILKANIKSVSKSSSEKFLSLFVK